MLKAITQQILVIVLLFSTVKLNGQQWLGRTTGNYSGTYGLYNNASSISDSKYKLYFNFWGRGVNFYNNNMDYNAPFKLNKWANGTYPLSYQKADGDVDFKKDWLIESMNGKTKQFSFNQDIWGPSFMFPISRKVNMSINTRQRNSMQIFGISEPFARMAYNGIDTNGNTFKGSNGLSRNKFYSNGKFGANIESYQELSFTLAGILAKNENHKLSGGATFKFIRGLGAAYIKGSQFDLSATGNNSMQVDNADIQYAYTDVNSVVSPITKPYGIFSHESKGFGGGLDLGLTYTFTGQPGKYARNKYCNENNLKSDYNIKIAAAFNDIGGIRYNQGAVKYNYTNTNLTNVNASTGILNGFNDANQNSFDTIGQNVFGKAGATKSNGFSTSLPAAFNLQTDFRLAHYLYTSIYWNQSLKSINSTGMKSTSILSVIPRFETSTVEISMPLTFSENYKNFYMGAYLRVGPVFIGSDNLGGLFKLAGNNQFSGADIYGGVSFGIGHCHKWYYESKVEPTYIDTVKQKDTVNTEKKDTVKEVKRDTVKIKVRDTVYINKKGETIKKIIHDTVYIKKKGEIIRDTVYIEKIIKTKEDKAREEELRKKEELIIIRQKQIEQREKELLEKEKGTYNEQEALRKCREEVSTITIKNSELKTKVINQSDEIIELQKRIEELNKNKTLNEAEIVRLKADRNKCENEVVAARKKADSLLTKLNAITIELNNCKKNTNVNNDAELVKAKAKAENDAIVARKKADSLQTKLDIILIELTNCKKNPGTTNDAELVKAKADKAKAENDAIISRKKADSLQTKLDIVTIDYINCKKNNGNTNDAELVKAKADKAKAENDAIIARKKADSLQVIVNTIQLDLDDCKKNGVKNDATVVKLKKAEDDRDLYKSELNEANKTIFRLNTKVNRQNAVIDSLMLELANCGKGDSKNDAEVIKKCNEKKAELEAEIIKLKQRVDAMDKSLDSANEVTARVRKEKAVLEAQIVELNKQPKEANCDEYVKQLEEKTKTINELNNENSALKLKVTNLTNQLNELKAEYLFVNTQNQKCSKKLDSCMRGLFNTKEVDPNNPDDNGGSKGNGGPFEGSNDNGDSTESSSVKVNSAEEIINIGVQIVKALANGSSSGTGTSTPSSGSKPSGTQTSGGTKTNTETKTKTETNSGSNGSRGTSGNTSGSTRRR